MDIDPYSNYILNSMKCYNVRWQTVKASSHTRDMLLSPIGLPYLYPSCSRTNDATKDRKLDSRKFWNLMKETIFIELQSKTTVLPCVERRVESNAYIFIVWILISTLTSDTFWLIRGIKCSDVERNDAAWIARNVPLWMSGVPYIYPSHCRTISATKDQDFESREIWNMEEEAI